MSIAPIQTLQQKKISTQLTAVLSIFGADTHLMRSVESFIDMERESIDWPVIFNIPFGSGRRGAATWAYGLWVNEQRPRANCFDAALSMSPQLQLAVLEALALRWGLKQTN
jgi:hypothetical protein